MPRSYIGSAAALLLFVTSALGAGSAVAAPTNQVGGPGGSQFYEECGAGHVLVGINFTAGKDINTIAGVCQTMTPEGTPDGNKFHMSTWGVVQDSSFDIFEAGGGPVMTEDAALCPDGTVIQSLEIGVSRHNILNAVRLKCLNIATGKNPGGNMVAQGVGGQAWRTETAACAPGTIANGILGGSGELVDRLGLLCTAYQAPPVKRFGDAFDDVAKGAVDALKDAGGAFEVGADDGINDEDNGQSDGDDPGNDFQGARANTDTTIFDEPEGRDQDYLEEGDAVTIIQCGDPEGWCEIGAPTYGWVWGSDLDR